MFWLSRCQAHDDRPEIPSPLVRNTALPTSVIKVIPADCPKTLGFWSRRAWRESTLLCLTAGDRKQDYVLTTDNLQPCLRGLDLWKVSQTIRDAIRVVEGLEFT
jgi:hypothetical protein